MREGVDSPMESRLRMLLVLAGFPSRVVNHLLRDDHGAVVRRLDLTYLLLRNIVEYDGRQRASTATPSARRRVRRLLRSRGATNLPRTFDPEWRVHFPGRPRS